MSSNGQHPGPKPGRSCQAVLAAFALLVAVGVWVLGSTASASTHARPAAACTSTEQPEIGFLIPNWSQVEWTVNGCGDYIRGVSQCIGGRLITTREGGYVFSAFIWSRATCPSAEPKITRAGYDVKYCATCTVTRHWYWPTAARQPLAASAWQATAPFTWAGLQWCPTFKGQDGCTNVQGQPKNFTNLFSPTQVRLASDGSVHLRMNVQESLSGAFNTYPMETFTPPYTLSATVLAPCTGGRLDNWPAVWATGTGSWPASGEFDIMEGLGGVPTWTYHYVNAAGQDAQVSRHYQLAVPCSATNYAVRVAGGVASFYADGQLQGQVAESCSAPCLPIGVPVASGPVVMRFDYATGRYGGPAVGGTTFKVLSFTQGRLSAHER